MHLVHCTALPVRYNLEPMGLWMGLSLQCSSKSNVDAPQDRSSQPSRNSSTNTSRTPSRNTSNHPSRACYPVCILGLKEVLTGQTTLINRSSTDMFALDPYWLCERGGGGDGGVAWQSKLQTPWLSYVRQAKTPINHLRHTKTRTGNTAATIYTLV